MQHRKNSKFRKLKVSVRTFLVLSTIGGVALAAAPAIALFQLLKPEKDNGWLEKQKKLIDYVFTKLDDSKLLKKLEETHESFSDSINNALDLGDRELWKEEHDKLYKHKPDKS